jgi:hypothetical protein
MTALSSLRVLRLDGFARQKIRTSRAPQRAAEPDLNTDLFLGAPNSFRERLLYLALTTPRPDYETLHKTVLELKSCYPNLWAAQLRDTIPAPELVITDFEYPKECIEEGEECRIDEADDQVIFGLAHLTDLENAQAKRKAGAAGTKVKTDDDGDDAENGDKADGAGNEVDNKPPRNPSLSEVARMALYHDPFQFLLALKVRASLPLTQLEQQAAAAIAGLTGDGLKPFPMAQQRVKVERVGGCP